jgi:hypothetical protein
MNARPTELAKELRNGHLVAGFHSRGCEGRRRRYDSCTHAPVAQLDRASVFGTEGCRFESYRAYFHQN